MVICGLVYWEITGFEAQVFTDFIMVAGVSEVEDTVTYQFNLVRDHRHIIFYSYHRLHCMRRDTVVALKLMWVRGMFNLYKRTKFPHYYVNMWEFWCCWVLHIKNYRPLTFFMSWYVLTKRLTSCVCVCVWVTETGVAPEWCVVTLHVTTLSHFAFIYWPKVEF